MSARDPSFHHGHVCPCADCVLDRSMRPTRIENTMPVRALNSNTVALQELVDNATLTLPRTYEIGEDWNDD